MIKITSVGEGEEKIDSSYEVYMALYHQLVGKEGKPDPSWKYNQTSLARDHLVDEVNVEEHAKDDSAWRKVLEYFSLATQIGMTATPKPMKEQTTWIISENQYIPIPYFKEFKMVSWLHIELPPTLSMLICRMDSGKR